MGTNTNIEWCHHTWNPVRGCTKISAGCKFCYAAELAKLNPSVLGEWGPTGRRSFTPDDGDLWSLPDKWNRAAEKAGEIRRVFGNSMWDPFEGEDGVREDYLPVLEHMRETFEPLKNLRLLLLTKRTSNMARWSRDSGWPATWWAGTSVEDQDAVERATHLGRVPAAVRFLSCEPLLGPVRLGQAVHDVNWIIVGGESGRNARPMHPDWARGLRDQAVSAGVPFHFKQWGEWAEGWPGDPTWDREVAEQSVTLNGAMTWGPAHILMRRIGKKAAGRVLDGRTWDEVPA